MMPLRALLAAALLCIAVTGLRAAEQPYRLDETRSDVRFSVPVLGVFRSEGWFETLTATLIADPADPTTVQLSADILTDSFMLDRYRRWTATVKGPDWFDTATHPHARFVSRTVTALDDGRYRAAGDMTLKGITRPVAFDIAIDETGRDDEVRFTATTRVDRRAFGMTRWSRFVGRTVTLKINAVFVADKVKNPPASGGPAAPDSP